MILGPTTSQPLMKWLLLLSVILTKPCKRWGIEILLSSIKMDSCRGYHIAIHVTWLSDMCWSFHLASRVGIPISLCVLISSHWTITFEPFGCNGKAFPQLISMSSFNVILSLTMMGWELGGVDQYKSLSLSSMHIGYRFGQGSSVECCMQVITLWLIYF